MLLTNTLVDGSHRVELTGLNTVNGLDFIVTPAILPPSLDRIADPAPIIEDSAAQTIQLTGIAKGRADGPPLQITATSQNLGLIPNPTVTHVDGDSTATLSYTPVADASGEAMIIVNVVDAGADQTFATDDDTLATEQFVVRVLEVDDRSIVLSGNGETLSLADPNVDLAGVQLIDIRGTGDNVLLLDAARMRAELFGGTVSVLSDTGDQLQFDDGWQFTAATSSGGRLVRQFINDGAVLNLVGPDDFTNPIDALDVNASGDVTTLDALQVINELDGRLFSDPASDPVGALRDFDAVDLSRFRFFDVTRDLHITALDALRVINHLARQANGNPGSSQGELIVGQVFSAPDGEQDEGQSLASARDDLQSKSRQVGGGSPEAIRIPAVSDAADEDRPAEEATSLAADAIDVVFADAAWKGLM